MLTKEQKEEMKKKIQEEISKHYESPEMQAAFEALINSLHKYESSNKSSGESMKLIEATCDLFFKHVEYLKTNSIDSIVTCLLSEKK